MLSEWGITPPRIVDTFSDEAMSVLVPALIRRRARESFAAVMSKAFSGGPGSAQAGEPSSSSPIRRDYRHPVSGRTQRVWGSANRPLTGADLEQAISEVARFDSDTRRNIKGTVH